MASEQQPRRENTTIEREIHLEKNRVPKMASHFEALAEQAKKSDVITGGKATPHGDLQESQGVGQDRPKATSANTMGDVGGRGKARETHELGSQFESISGKIKHERDTEDGKQREGRAERQRSQSMPVDKEAMAKYGAGPTHVVGKFEVTKDEQGWRGASAEARHGTGEAGRRVVDTETGKEGEELSKERETHVGGAERKEGGGLPSLEEIGKYRGEAQQNSMEAIKAAEERYQKAKESAGQAVCSAAETAKERGGQAKGVAYEKAKQAKDLAMEKASQAKEVALEKGQQGYTMTTNTLSNAAKNVSEYTSPMAEKAKDYTVQMAVGAKEAAKSAGQTAAEKAAQAKDVTLEGGKGAPESAGKVAAGFKDKAAAVGWTAAHYTTEKTVEGTKAAVRAVEGVAEYAGHKAMELASKPISAAKDLAASTAETAKEYTARKKEEAHRELEAKRSGRQELPSDTAARETFPRGGEQGEQGKGSTLGSMGGTISDITKKTIQPVQNIIGERLQGVQQQSKEGKGGGIMGSVRETVGDIGPKIIPHGENVEQEHFPIDRHHGKEGKASELLGAVGETIGEIADTAKNLVVGEDPSAAGSVMGIGADANTTTEHDKRKVSSEAAQKEKS